MEVFFSIPLLTTRLKEVLNTIFVDRFENLINSTGVHVLTFTNVPLIVVFIGSLSC